MTMGIARRWCWVLLLAHVRTQDFPPGMEEFTSEERVLREYLLSEVLDEPLVQKTPTASAVVANPTGLLVVGWKIYASEFRANRVLVASAARSRHRRRKEEGSNKNSSAAWRVFAERGPHCRKNGRNGRADCGILDGPWGLAWRGDELFVASFGSDQILSFSRKTGKFARSIGSSDSLDSPEGLAIRGSALFAASFLDSRIVAFDLDSAHERVIAAGDPVDVDVEAGVFVDANSDVIEARRELWGLTREDVPQLPMLRGPEQLLFTSSGSLLVSSLHNQSVLEIATEDGSLLSADLGLAADGPLGVALVSDPTAADLFRRRARLPLLSRGDVLLVASYRTDDVLAVDLAASSSVGSLRLGSEEALLRGPAALALDHRDPGGIYVACYESGAVLYFNLSSDDLLRDDGGAVGLPDDSSSWLGGGGPRNTPM